MIRGVVRYLDQRSGAAPLVRKALRYVFPDHWSFLLGEVALYCFVLLVATGIYLTLFFESKLIAHIHVNWLAPVKVRRTLIGGSKKMIVYDDLEPSEKIKVYDKGITLADGGKKTDESVYEVLVSYRTGDMWAPKLDGTEALRVEALHFLKAIEKNEPLTKECESGLRIVQILEAATQSIADRGRPVEIADKA